MRSIPRWLNGLIAGLLLFASVGAVPPATQAASRGSHLPAGAIVINEFVPAPQTVFTQEKIELYNTTSSPLDVGGLWIDDIAAGGGAARQIPPGTTIPAFGFYLHSDANFLNNGGDDVRLLDEDGSTVLDSRTYAASPGYDAAWDRQCDGGPWSASANPSPTLGASNGACSGTWTPGAFEIHIFDVEQGDSQLIVSPSGKTLLIDVREPSFNSGSGAAYIADKLRQVMGPSFSHVDYIMPSHLHLDHIGNAGVGGIWALLEVHGFTVGKLVDRDAGAWVDGDGNGLCNPNTEIVWYNAGTQSSTARNWLCYVTNPANASTVNREIAVIDSTTQIDLGPGVTVKIVQRDAEDVTLIDGVTPLRGDHTTDPVPPSENDYSIGLKVTFGLLDYATAGDSDGEYDTSEFGYTYNDVEAVLAARMGVVDVMRANHHGSGHSTSQLYADTLQPQASFISCGDNTFGHPEQTTLDRLLSWGAVYLTNLCDPTRNYGASVIVDGDIVLQSTDGVNYTIDGTPFVASNPATPTPTATATSTPTPTPTPAPQAASFTSLASEDGYIQESSESSNAGGTAFGTGTTVRGGDDGSDRQWLSVLSFDTASLPDNAAIVGVELRLQRSGVTGTSPFGTHGALWADVKSGAYGNNNALAASDFEAASTASQVASLSNPLNNDDWASGFFDSAGRAAVNLTGRTQVKVRFNLDDNDDLSGDYMGFRSGEATTTSRPVLIVNYVVP